MQLVDADSHLYEPRTMWRDYADPDDRELAMVIEDDELGYAWLTWQGRRLHEAEVQIPGELAALGEARAARRRGERSPVDYDEALPAAYTEVGARVALLDEQGLDATVVFPNHGLVWERQLDDDPRAKRANMRAHNRWMVDVVAEGAGRLWGVGHLELSDVGWVRDELWRLADGGVTLAMVGPSPVGGSRSAAGELAGGKSLAHPDLDPVWAAFVEHDVAPVFHVGAHTRPFQDAWYDQDPDPVNPFLDSVLLWAAPAAALTNMACFGVFERHPRLRVGVVELSAWWLPAFLLHLDGGVDFISKLLGRPPADLSLPPADYVRRQVRVAALAYEQPARMIKQAGEDLFMFGSDWPHAEGIADPVGDYRAANPDLEGRAAQQLYAGNVSWLAGR